MAAGASPHKVRQNLAERTARFGISAIASARSVKQDAVTRLLISQFIRAATSVGANYCEASEAESKKDFTHKIGICAKEAKETSHWLRMFAEGVPARKPEVRRLWLEAKELALVFGAIVRSCRASEKEASGKS